MNEAGKTSEKSHAEELFDNLVWMNSREAAAYLRKFTKEGEPSVGAIRAAVCRGQIRARKWRRRLYFKRVELDRLIDAAPFRGGI